MSWIHTRTKKVESVKEMNKILQDIKFLCNEIIYRKREDKEAIKWNAFVEDDGFKIKVTWKPGDKAQCIIFDKDGKHQIKLEPKNAVSQMSRAYKIERIEEYGINPKDIPPAKPLLYKNKKFDGKETIAYEYDLTNAYAQMLKEPLPDTKTIKRNRYVKSGEIGFIAIGNDLLIVNPGAEVEADYVFKLMESPYIKWVDRLFQRCEKAQTKEEKDEVKSVYRFAVGDLQNINPFWRATIVQRCNKLIKYYMDENTIYCNTDSIVSSVRRYDIEADTKYNWKLKRCGEKFKWRKAHIDYQWNDETPTLRGAKKRYIEYYNKTHEEKFDILKDKIPNELQHQYYLDRESFQIKENEL